MKIPQHCTIFIMVKLSPCTVVAVLGEQEGEGLQLMPDPMTKFIRLCLFSHSGCVREEWILSTCSCQIFLHSSMIIESSVN